MAQTTITYPDDIKCEIEYLVYAAAIRLGGNAANETYWRPVVERLEMEDSMQTVEDFSNIADTVL